MPQPKFSGIPHALSSIPQWVVWKNIISVKKPRGRKIPISVRDLGAGSSTNPNTWGTFETAKRLCEQYNFSGIGFVLTKDCGIFCADIDECILEDGTITDEAGGIIAGFEGKTYIEGSYHQDGVHIFGFGNLPDGEAGGKRKDENGKEVIEFYDSGRFIAITGWRLLAAHTDLVDHQRELDKLLKRYTKSKKTATSKPQTPHKHKSTKSCGKTITDKTGLVCSHIGAPVGSRRTTNGLQGGHPFHGSTTGNNFSINEDGNTWYCFRHEVGGGALELYAISKGIINCEDSGCGCLDGKWSEVFAALNADGYNIDPTPLLPSIFTKRRTARESLASLGVI